MMNALLLIPLVLILDRLLGEPKWFHPLVGFGKIANWLEIKLNTGSFRFNKGFIAWFIAVIPLTILVSIIDNALGGLWLSLLFGWLAIGWQSLREHGMAVADALNGGDLAQARIKTSYLVSRETSELNEEALSKATIESVLENGSDAIFAPLIWLFVFGAWGVVFYRLCNTLDAMWGYRSERFEQFGKFTARLDDVLNYIPARITAMLYLLCGNTNLAWKAWRTQAKSWYSPNAGVVMATGAGALNLHLGGAAVYHGKQKLRPQLGFNHQPQSNDIERTIRLIDNSVYCVAGIFFIPLIIGSIWLGFVTYNP